ncbi:MAG: enoyl-CoA hydratase/isomerase family protein [Hymenobacter sp.]
MADPAPDYDCQAARAGPVRGSELAMALDMRFAARGRAAIGQTEVLMGIIPGGGATAYLPRLVGRARALEAIVGANLFDADLAERYGWVNRPYRRRNWILL